MQLLTEPEVLTRNVAALQAAQPDFIPLDNDFRVQFVDGAWKLFDEPGGSGAAIHSRDPHREADRTVDSLFAQGERPLVVAIGLGLGFLLDALERRGWTGKVLALEPAPRTVRRMLERRDWRDWITSGRLRILTAPDFVGAGECWRWFGEGIEPAVFVHQTLARLRPEQVARAHAVLKRIRYDAAANAAARRDHGARYLLNTLRNLPAVAAEADAAQLFDAFRGTPAVVVGAGPSLDSTLPALYDVRDSAVIVAVDTALRPLLRAGIAPHVVVAVDPSEANGRHLTDLSACPDTFLVTEGSLDPFAVDGFRGRTFFFAVSDHQPWPWLRAAGRPVATLRAWGSVLTTAYDLALKMGCNPIVFLGADLSYPDERPYCRGVSFEEEWQRRALWGEPIEQQWRDAVALASAGLTKEDVSGAPVRTAAHLVAFRDWLAEQIGRETNRRVVNASGAGILAGPRVEQVPPARLRELVGPARPGLRKTIRSRYRPAPGQVMDAAARLVSAASRGVGAANAVLGSWEAFAPGVTREALLDALQAAIDNPSGSGTPGRGNAPLPTDPVRTTVAQDAEVLGSVLAAMPLVAMRIPPHRMQKTPGASRMFRLRTLASRVLCSAARPNEEGVAEDGRSLRRVYDLSELGPGCYVAFRDEVHFCASDDSDPRFNGRQYTLLVPSAVAYLEGLPLEDILQHHV